MHDESVGVRVEDDGMGDGEVVRKGREWCTERAG